MLMGRCICERWIGEDKGQVSHSPRVCSQTACHKSRSGSCVLLDLVSGGGGGGHLSPPTRVHSVPLLLLVLPPSDVQYGGIVTLISVGEGTVGGNR